MFTDTAEIMEEVDDVESHEVGWWFIDETNDSSCGLEILPKNRNT